jgi:hypothetical protein
VTQGVEHLPGKGKALSSNPALQKSTNQIKQKRKKLPHLPSSHCKNLWNEKLLKFHTLKKQEFFSNELF